MSDAETLVNKQHTTMTKQTINYDSVKKALATIDSRFVVFDDMQSNDRANYCSLRLVLKDKSIDSRKVFCIYYNASCVTIHCAKRFESVCDTMYKLNAKRTEYTLTCKLDMLATYVHSLLAHECARLKMSAYTQTQTQTTVSKRKQKTEKAK